MKRFIFHMLFLLFLLASLIAYGEVLKAVLGDGF